MEVTETKFLGVIMNVKLELSTHILWTRETITKGISILLKVIFLFDSEALLSFDHITHLYLFIYTFASMCGTKHMVMP